MSPEVKAAANVELDAHIESLRAKEKVHWAEIGLNTARHELARRQKEHYAATEALVLVLASEVRREQA